jgi:hypothetical protein
MSDFSAILERLRELEEGFTNDVDMELHRIAKSGDEEDLIDAIEGLKGDELQIALEDMMADLADYLASKGMNDVIDDQDKMIELLMDKIVDEYRFTGDDDDGQPSSHDEYQDLYGGDDYDHGQFDEASWINGKKQDDKELVWKQTSMSYEKAVEQYGKEHVKLGGKNKLGQQTVQVHVPLVAEGQYQSQYKSKEDAIAYAKDKAKTFRDPEDGIEIWSMPDGGFDAVHNMNSNGRNHCVANGGKKLGTIGPRQQGVAEGDLDESYDEEKYVDSSFDKMLNFVDTVTKMVEKPRLADAIKNIGGDPSSLYNIKQKLDNLYDNVQDGHYEAIAHLDSTSYDDMEESQDSIEDCGEAGDMREQRLAQRVNELTQRLQSFKEQLSEMDPAPQDPEEIRKQQTITTNLNQMKAAGVDIDPTKGTEDPAFNKEVGSKVAAAMADPALGQQLKGVLGKIKD